MASSTFGPAARQVSPQQFAAYKQAFQGYIGRKYGARFREFIGSKIEVTGAKPVKSFFVVTSVAKLNGRAPMQVEWHVSDKSGSARVFNLIIEGVNMLTTERTEVGAMLDQAGGSVAKLADRMKQA